MASSDDEQGIAILEAASKLLSEEGAGALTVRRIATEAGCSTMGLYSRFGGKDGVVDQLYVQGFDQLCDAMSAAPQDRRRARRPPPVRAHATARLRSRTRRTTW